MGVGYMGIGGHVWSRTRRKGELPHEFWWQCQKCGSNLRAPSINFIPGSGAIEDCAVMQNRMVQEIMEA